MEACPGPFNEVHVLFNEPVDVTLLGHGGANFLLLERPPLAYVLPLVGDQRRAPLGEDLLQGVNGRDDVVRDPGEHRALEAEQVRRVVVELVHAGVVEVQALQGFDEVEDVRQRRRRVESTACNSWKGWPSGKHRSQRDQRRDHHPVPERQTKMCLSVGFLHHQLPCRRSLARGCLNVLMLT